MYLWGDKELKIVPGTYNPPFALKQRSIIEIIPSISTSYNSVLQDGGRERKRAAMEGFCISLEEYNELYNDYLAAIEKTFTGPTGETLTGIIYELSAPTRVMYKKYEYSITLLEV